MRLADFGENSILEYIRQLAATRLHLDSAQPKVSWIGSDCADLRNLGNGLQPLIVSKDLLIENVHFLRNKIPPDWLAAKSLRVNLSDLAAGGAQPRGCLLGLGLPKSLPWKWLRAFLDRFSEECLLHNLALWGGDLTEAENITISLTVFGTGSAAQTVNRSQAREGDVLCVTGFLGDSAAGLRLIQGLGQGEDLADPGFICSPAWLSSQLEDFELSLVLRHYLPRPRWREAVHVVQQARIWAMMDLSDGLFGDAVKMAQASRCHLQINLEDLPLSPELLKHCQGHRLRALHLALKGGEDYELLMAIAPGDFEKCKAELQHLSGLQFTKIGTVRALCTKVNEAARVSVSPEALVEEMKPFGPLSSYEAFSS